MKTLKQFCNPQKKSQRTFCYRPPLIVRCFSIIPYSSALNVNLSYDKPSTGNAWRGPSWLPQDLFRALPACTTWRNIPWCIIWSSGSAEMFSCLPIQEANISQKGNMNPLPRDNAFWSASFFELLPLVYYKILSWNLIK